MSACPHGPVTGKPFGWVCPKCGHWDTSPAAPDQSNQVLIQLAGLEPFIRLARDLRLLQRSMIDRGLHAEADRLDRIITEFEIRK